MTQCTLVDKLVVHNVVMRFSSNRHFPTAYLAAIFRGNYSRSAHGGPASIRVLEPFRSSWRILSRQRGNVAGVPSFPATCAAVWLMMLKISEATGKSFMPSNMICVNIHLTVYLGHAIDLRKLQSKLPEQTGVYNPENISSLCMPLFPRRRRVMLVLYPNGNGVIVGAPTIDIAIEGLQSWMSLIESCRVGPSIPDPLRLRSQQSRIQRADREKSNKLNGRRRHVTPLPGPTRYL